MYPDEQEKKVRIPIRIVNGQVKYFYGGNLPRIRTGAIGELILSENSIEDESFIKVSQQQHSVELLPSGTTIMVAVSSQHIPSNLKKAIERINLIIDPACDFVGVNLVEPLQLLFRGSKKATLLDNKCFISSLKIEASSLNYAYTIISQRFEPHRRSHTGNVFKKCYYESKGKWFQLDRRRNTIERDFENTFFLDTKRFVLKPTLFESNYNDDEILLINAFKGKSLKGSDIKKLFDNNMDRYLIVVNKLLDNNLIEEINT